MHVGLWFLLVPAIFFVLVWVDYLLAVLWVHFKPASAKLTKTQYEGSGAPGSVLIYMPGILARSKDQLESVKGADSLLDLYKKDFKKIILFDYSKRFFNRTVIVRQLRMQIAEEVGRNNSVKVVGVSLGADLVNEALAGIHNHENLKFVVVDAPAGRDTLPKAAGIMSAILFLFPVGKGLLLGCATIPVLGSMLPKENETQDGLPSDEVRKLAKKGLSGFTARVYTGQLTYMVNFVLLPIFAKTYYIACVEGNVTVKQPEAMQKWVSAAFRKGLDIIEVPAPHAAFLQQPKAFTEVFKEIFSS